MSWKSIKDDDGGRFVEFLSRVRPEKELRSLPPSLLSIDPGETVGWSYWEYDRAKYCGQLELGPHRVGWGVTLHKLLGRFRPSVIVIERFSLYAWKAKSQSWSEMYTSRVIGAVEIWAQLQSPPIKVVFQGAGVAKPFCTNDKLRQWGLLQTVTQLRHANDALRHACYYLLFSKTLPGK